ncbi:MAG: polymer-forming cytoskeletal protein [Myxococcota bacterium]|nr:polymer-forming cytoskeletal protein [Myxococcota bacterium]
MAFRKGRSEGESMPETTTRPTTSGSNLSAFIDQGSEFEGKLTFKDTVRIDGRFRGEISSENTLVVGETGEIEATVRSRHVAISGAVVGNIFASQQLVLHKTARIEGDIEAGSLAVEEGAIVNGGIKMKGGEVAARGLEALPGGKHKAKNEPPPTGG